MKEGYKKTEVGVIPEDWEIKELNEVSNITRLAGAEYSDLWQVDENGEIVALRGFNIGENKLILNNVERISKSLSERLNRSKLYKNDIVFPCVGTIGKSAVINEDNKYHINQNIAKITPDKSMNSLYLSYFLISEIVKKEILKYNTSSSQPNVLVGNLRKFKIITPPLKEQEKIADILSTVDCQIDDTDKLIDKCKALKKGLMQRLLTKGIGHTEFKKTEVGEIPVSWKVKKFSDISKVNQGLQIAIEDRFKESSENRLPYITIQYINDKNNKDNEFYIENANNSVICKEDDILMTRTGNTGEVVTNENGVFHNNFFKIDFDRNLLTKDYLVYYLKSNEIQKLIRRYAGSTTIPDLKHSDFYRIPVLIPSIQEQEKIAQILSSVDNEIEECKNKKQNLEELKKGLMQQLLTGKMRTI